MRKDGGFQRKSKTSSDIPSSSLADMAFLLLIFFMVTTVFRKDEPRPVEFPEAEATQKLDEQRANIVHIWVESNGDIWINDQLIPQVEVSGVIGPMYRENNELVPVLRADRNVPYRVISGIQEELQESGAVRLTFYTDTEQRITRERR